MRSIRHIKNIFGFFTASAMLVGAAYAQATGDGTIQMKRVVANSREPVGLRMVNQPPATSLSKGEQDKQKTEINFDPTTETVTVKTLLQDPNGRLLSNIRRDNFAVYENDIRQTDASIEIEHAPVSLAVLVEWGGRYQVLNKALAEEVSRVLRPLSDGIGKQDKVAVFRYGDRLEKISDFSSDQNRLSGLLVGLEKPDFSEANFYDALISTVDFMKNVRGRKAIILISSGVDTFSKAKFEDVLTAVHAGETPVYVVSIGPVLRGFMERLSTLGSRIDWDQASSGLQKIANESGGRLYVADNTSDMASAYDDLMENLRLRYVITYKSSNVPSLSSTRTVRIELVDPKNGGPLEVFNASGKKTRTKLVVESQYTPQGASTAALNTSAPQPPEE